MCGINGALRLTPGAPALAADELREVRDRLAARGPDGAGLWLSPDGRVGFGHRRLAVVDLSPAGSQPMSTEDGRFTLVFNGEIYNHRELRAELEGRGEVFRSRGDAEVLLRLFAREDVGLFARLEGMYAFAVWDALQARLVLARDPFGIKPLYYAEAGERLLFASQVRALESVAGLSPALDPAGLCGFLLWGSLPEPFTLRRAVRALPAGHWLEARDGRVGEPRRHVGAYRRARVVPPREALRAASEALTHSVAQHLQADVPVGLFLSAGLDSALIAALARRVRSAPLPSLTLSFDAFRGGPLDEGPGAARLADVLGLDHREERVTPEALAELWPRALRAMDQPSVDGFNIYAISHYARAAGLKVMVSGLGGDELFGGYPSFRDVPAWARAAVWGRRVPGLATLWPALTRPWRARLPKLPGLLRHAWGLTGAYFLRRALYLPEELPGLIGDDLAREGLAGYDPLADLERHLSDGASHLDNADGDWPAVQRLECGQYLRSQLLRDADWASMAHGLELRVPLLSAGMWTRLRASGFEAGRWEGKAPLVRALAPELPAAVLARDKSGFAVPQPPDLGASMAWGLQARRRAVRVLRERFGIEVGPPAPRRGGTLFLMAEVFRQPGGIQTYNRDQVQALRRCRADEPLSALVLNDAAADVARTEWRHVNAAGLDRRKLRFAWRALARALVQQPTRVLIGHRHLLPLVPLVRLGAPRARTWLLAYGIEAEQPFSRLERLLLKGVTRACAISPATAALLTRAGWTHPVELWPCGLPFDFALPAPVPPRFGRPLRLLAVSRLAAPERYKGLDDALRALALLRARGVDAHLDLAGDGEDRARLERITREEGVGGQVTFHGRVSADELRRLYAECDVFVLPSGGEGFGIVYLEALAHARPVVAADAAGAPFVVRPGVSGHLVPYGDPERLARCLAEMAARPDDARRLGLSGRRFLEEHFTFEMLVERTRALLDGDA